VNARDVPQPLQGVLISVLMLGTLLGGFILAANDRSLNPIGLLNPIDTRVAIVARTPVGTQATPPDFATPTALTPTATPTPICPAPPADWIRIDYSQSETPLPTIALLYNTTLERLFEVNCLDKVPLQAQPWLYVPANALTLVPTPVVVSCFPPPGWPVYRVQWGDTLSSLAARFNISVVLLMRYNCLNSSQIYQGQLLYVPYALPLWTPSWTLTPLPTWTPTPWMTVTPIDTPTQAPTLMPTDTLEPPLTLTVEVPTDTPPTFTLTPLPTLPPTETPAPSLTPTVAVPTDIPPTFTPPTMPPPTDTPPTFAPPTETPVPLPTLPQVTPGLP
jgi:LysM repeat protein